MDFLEPSSAKALSGRRRGIFHVPSAPGASLWVGIILAVLCSNVPPGWAGESPLEVIRKSNQAILDIYASAEEIDAAAEEEIFRIVDGVTDFEIISGAVTDRFCDSLEPEQCKEFNEVFVELLRSSSVKKLGRYRADSFDYLGEETGEGEAVVETAAHFNEEKLALVYHLALSEGEWRIVNYIVDDVDTIRNYRKQFTRLFAKKSFEAVMQRLRDRIAAYEQEASRE